MSDDYKTWWEIPSIVHFCKVFSPFCEDLCPININEFELAVEENSLLLTDMALRFMKIYGFYDPNTNDWWPKMKQIFQMKCDEYHFEYPLDSVLTFDDLTPKRKVEALYIMCHIALDVEVVQFQISNKPELWHKFNVKPLGYDLNNSVYWYFGTTKLYREDFDNLMEWSVNSSLAHDTKQYSESDGDDSSKTVFQSAHTQPYPSGILGSGKWNTICDDDRDSWLSFADDTKFSKNAIIRSLHNSVCNIIKNLPNIKRNKFNYKYLKYSKLKYHNKTSLTRSLRSTSAYETDVNKLSICSAEINKYSSQVQDEKTKQYDLFSEPDKHINKSVLIRSLRSTSANEANVNKLSKDSIEIIRRSPQSFQDQETKQDHLFSEINKPKNNTNISVRTQNVLRSKNVYDNERSSVKRFCNGENKLPLNNTIELPNANFTNLSKVHQDILKYEARVNLIRYNQEDYMNSENSQTTMR